MSIMAPEHVLGIRVYAHQASYTGQEVVRVFWNEALDLTVPMLRVTIEARIRAQLEGFNQLTVQIHQNRVRMAWWAPQKIYRPSYAREKPTHAKALVCALEALGATLGWPADTHVVLVENPTDLWGIEPVFARRWEWGDR